MTQISQINVMEYSATLAAALAADLLPIDEVFASHGISPIAGRQMLAQPWFSEMVETARREWAAVGNTKDRIRIKAQLAVEEAIPLLYLVINDAKQPATARVAAFKELKEVAGVSAKEAEAPAGQILPIQIFLNDNGPVVISRGPETVDSTSAEYAQVINIPVPSSLFAEADPDEADLFRMVLK